MVTIEIIEIARINPDRFMMIVGMVSMGIMGVIASFYSEERCWGLPGLIVGIIKRENQK